MEYSVLSEMLNRDDRCPCSDIILLMKLASKGPRLDTIFWIAKTRQAVFGEISGEVAVDSRSSVTRHTQAPSGWQLMSGVELRSLSLLPAQRLGQLRHLLLERLAVVLHILRAHVAARRQHVAVPPHVLQRRRLAEAGDIDVGAGPPPCNPPLRLRSPRQAW